jgi:formylglycine-generating enzyme required for sulfatase activity
VAPPSPSPAAAPLGQEKEITNSIKMKLIRISPGSFRMGSPRDEQDDILAKLPKSIVNQWTHYVRSERQHDVEITRTFYLGVYEVTQGQYQKIMGNNPSHFSAFGQGRNQVQGLDTTDFPVEKVSYNDAIKFCEKLSALPAEKKAGRVYRLPTEAEWEYACRAPAPPEEPPSPVVPYSFGKSISSNQANFNGNTAFGGGAKGTNLQRTCKVGSYKPNRFGLYDMHGNVYEICSDWYDKDYFANSPKKDPKGPEKGLERVIKGGAWNYDGGSCRSGSRNSDKPGDSGLYLGFRVALSVGGVVAAVPGK